MRLLFSFICCISHVVSCNVPAVYSDDPVTTVYFSHFVDKARVGNDHTYGSICSSKFERIRMGLDYIIYPPNFG